MDLHSDPIVVFRIAERLTLTAVVLVAAAVVMVGFWRSVQKLDVQKAGGLGISGSVMFSTPVFILLTIVGYAYVSLSHPITVNPGGTPVAEGEERRAALAGQSGFLGASRSGVATEATEYDQSIAQRRIRSLNCLAERGSLSPRLEDDLADTKLLLMGQVWSGDWGDISAFANWTRGQTGASPNQAAQDFFEARHVIC